MIQRSVTGLTALAIGTFWLALSAAAQTTDVDLSFIDNMTTHHQGAVHMAGDALKKAKPEVKTFARQIIKDQTGEMVEDGMGEGVAHIPAVRNTAIG